jgi:hypothetical protein
MVADTFGTNKKSKKKRKKKGIKKQESLRDECIARYTIKIRIEPAQ